MLKTIKILLLSTLILIITACGGDSSPAEKPDKAPVVVINNTKVIFDDQNLVLFAEATDDNRVSTFLWKDENGNAVGDKALLTINAPHNTGVYDYAITVTDNKGLATTKTVRVTISERPDNAPVIFIESTKIINNDQDLILFAEATDDGEIISYNWKDQDGKKVGDKALLTINAPHNAGVFNYSIIVTDDNGQKTTKVVKVTISVRPDDAPIVTITSTKTINENQDLILFAEATDDGEITSYSWQDNESNDVGSKALLSIKAPHQVGTREFSITVTDDENQSTTKTVTVTINPEANATPVITISPTKTIYDNQVLELFAEATDDGKITTYAWKNTVGNVVGNKALLTIAAPHEIAQQTFSIIVTDNKGVTATKTVVVTIKDSRYTQEDNNVPIYVANKSFDQYKLAQISDSRFNALSTANKYKAADKLLASLFFAYPQHELKSKIESGNFISGIQNQLLVSSNNMSEVNSRIHDAQRYYQSDSRPDVLILSRFYEMSKLDKHYYDHWISYILTQTILFSPAAELDTVSEPDSYGVYNRLYDSQSKQHGMRYATFEHMQSNENWRRFRSPEDNGREMLEIYALNGNDADVPIAAQALKNWYLSKLGDTLVVGLDKNTEPLNLMGDMSFTTGVDFYAALVNSKAFTKGITTRLVNFMFTSSNKAKKIEIINKIVSSKPETWSDILSQIVFSTEYLLHTARPRSIEENVFPLMKKFSFNSNHNTFNSLNNEMKKMGQASLRYKLGKLNRIPLDDISFATYQSYLTKRIFRMRSRDTALSWDPSKVDATHNSDYFMSNYKHGYRTGISAKHFMSADKYQVVEDNPEQTQTNYINYLFNSVLNRNASNEELTMFLDHLNKPTPQWFGKQLTYLNDDKDKQAYIRYTGRYYMQYIVFEYISRLDELFFFKEVTE